MSLVNHIIEAFQALGGDRSLNEVEVWVIKQYGDRWAHSSFGTTMADMVPIDLGGNHTSTIPLEKRVLKRMRPGIYCLLTNSVKSRTWIEPKDEAPKAASSNLNVFVTGAPSPFANPGEHKWKDQLRAQVPNTTVSHGLKGLTLTFGYQGRGDLDNLCEPIFSVVVNERGWFGGHRASLEWWIASKVTSRSGCRITASNGDPPVFGFGKVVFEGEFEGSLPGRATDTKMLEWVKSHYGGETMKNGVGVELVFNGWKVNIGDIATGPVKSCIDCLQPILGGSVSGPDDWKISSLLVRCVRGSGRSVSIHVFSF